MRKQFTTIAILLASIYVVNSMILFNTEPLPKSKPTQVELFMDEIAKIESPNSNHTIVSTNGMLGRYQFSFSTIKSLGFTEVTREQFLRNRKLQDSVMVKYMKENYRELSSLIERYNGKVVNGVKVTRAGVLAGAHFAGTVGVRQFLVTGGQVQVVDGNGTTISNYMSRFSKFPLPPFKI